MQGGGYRLSRLHPLLTKAGVAAAALAVALTVAPAPALAGQPSAVAAQQIAKAQQAAVAAGHQYEPTTVTVSNEAELRQAVETVKADDYGYGIIILSADINLSSTLTLEGASFDLQLVDVNGTAHTLSANQNITPIAVKDAGISLTGGAVKANGATAIQATFQSENQYASIDGTAVTTTGAGSVALSISGPVEARAMGVQLTSEAGPAVVVSDGAAARFDKGYVTESTASIAVKGAPIAKVSDANSSVTFNEGTYTLASGNALFDVPSDAKDAIQINGGKWPTGHLNEVKVHLIDHATVDDKTGVVTGAEYPGATYVTTEVELRQAIQDAPDFTSASWESTTIVIAADIKLGDSLLVPAKNIELVSTADGSLSCVATGKPTVVVDAVPSSVGGPMPSISVDAKIAGNNAAALQVKSGNVSIGGSRTALSATDGSSPLVVDQGASASIGAGTITASGAAAIVSNGTVYANSYGFQGPSNELLVVTGDPVASVGGNGNLSIKGGTFRLADNATSNSLFISENTYSIGISSGVFDTGHDDEIELYLSDDAVYDPATGIVSKRSPISTEEELRAAIADVPAGGTEKYATIQLAADITLSQSLEVTAGKRISLDGQGHTITGPSNAAALVVDDGARVSTYSITLMGNPVADVKLGGLLSISGGTFQRTDSLATPLFADANGDSEGYDTGIFIYGGTFKPAGEAVAQELAPYLERTDRMYDKTTGEVKQYTPPVVSDEEALRQAIADAKEGKTTNIIVAADIQLTDVLTIPANRNINLTCQNNTMVTLTAALGKPALKLEASSDSYSNFVMNGISLKGNSVAAMVLPDADNFLSEWNSLSSGGASSVSVSCDASVTPIEIGKGRRLIVNGVSVSATGAVPVFAVQGSLEFQSETSMGQQLSATVNSDGPIAAIADDGRVSIEHGTFTCTGDELFANSGDNTYLNVSISGGTFLPADESTAKKIAPLLEDRYQYNTEDGKVTEKPSVEVALPNDGGKKGYMSLSEALEPGNSPAGSTLTILRSDDNAPSEYVIDRPLTIKGDASASGDGSADYLSLFNVYFRFVDGSGGSTLQNIRLSINEQSTIWGDNGEETSVHQCVLVDGASNITIQNCSLEINDGGNGGQANTTPAEPDKACVRVRNASNIDILDNDFNLWALTRTAGDFLTDSVAVDLQGSKSAPVRNVVVRGNNVSTNYYVDTNTDESKMGDTVFVKANGDAAGDFASTGSRGVSDVSLTENKVSGSGNSVAHSGFAELSAVNGITFQKNEVSNLVFGVRQSSSAAANTGVVVNGGSYTNDNADGIWVKSPMNPTVEDTKDEDGVTVPGIKYEKDLDVLGWVTSQNHGDVPEAPAGMVFGGWYFDGQFEMPFDSSQSDSTCHAKFVPTSDVIKFQGGSLRMDLTGEDGKPDYTKTNLRFGYVIDAPGEKASWKWKLSFGDGTTEYVREGDNKVKQADGGYRSNVVITNITSQYYDEVDHAVLELTYTTPDGTPVTVTDAKQSRSVKDVVDTILAEGSGSKQEEKDYAKNLKNAMTSASEAA